MFLYSIIFFLSLCNCAILPLGMPLEIQHGAGDFREAHLSNVPGGGTKGVDGVRCVEVDDLLKILLGVVISRIHPAACHHEQSHAVGEKAAVHGLYTVFVQLFQIAAFPVVVKLGKIVRHIVLHRIPGGTAESSGKGGGVLQRAEAAFQRLHNGILMLRLHLPHRHRAGEPSRMGVGKVEVVFQP